jgi:H+/Cl- antiporter ClcA
VAEGYHGLHGKLVDRFGTKGDALYTFVACLLALAVSGLAAYAFKQPLLFPSLGPTAFLFFEQPLDEPSSPRDTLIGHFVAILAGALCLAVFGLLDHPSILTEGVTLARVGAGALSVALTGAILLLLAPSVGCNRAHREPGALADTVGDGNADARRRHPDRRRLGH